MRAPDGNLFDRPPPATGEVFEVLARLGGCEVERIVSSSHPEPGEYRQAHAEWVVLLKGGARLQVAGELVSLKPGDHLLLPADEPHRVLATEEGTVWLAVHARGAPAAKAQPALPEV
ncbi:MAG: cupin domain-containing protein [Myxococcales bacterium]|nr:cupin domain-containing protein [Myxococcales bacterium]MCB9523691.1 cupin domain-containing protein [Myxococcales bacterium]